MQALKHDRDRIGGGHRHEEALLPAQALLEETHELAPRDVLAVCHRVGGPVGAAALTGQAAGQGEILHVTEAEDFFPAAGDRRPAVVHAAQEPQARRPVVGTVHVARAQDDDRKAFLPELLQEQCLGHRFCPHVRLDPERPPSRIFFRDVRRAVAENKGRGNVDEAFQRNAPPGPAARGGCASFRTCRAGLPPSSRCHGRARRRGSRSPGPRGSRFPAAATGRRTPGRREGRQGNGGRTSGARGRRPRRRRR